MNHIYILEADPTAFGGIQQFVRSLGSYLPQEQVTLLAYYGKLSHYKKVETPLLNVRELANSGFSKRLSFCWDWGYRSSFPYFRNLALLLDIPRIRCALECLLHNDTLVLNSASAMFLLCTPKVLRENRIILVQHTCPRMMKRRAYDFGGVFRKWKLSFFQRYVETFVMLSPFERKNFREWLPIDGKNCPVIRHAMPFPESVPKQSPRSAAVLSRFIPLKRIDRIISAAKLLPDVDFNLYGTGPLEKKLRKMASNLENVHFRGYTNNIDAVFRDNSLLLITSDYEGYSISGIEACVRGRPVIVLDTYSSACDLVENGINGIVLKNFSAQALASAIEKVLENPDHYREGALKHRSLYEVSSIRNSWRSLIGEKKISRCRFAERAAEKTESDEKGV